MIDEQRTKEDLISELVRVRQRNRDLESSINPYGQVDEQLKQLIEKITVGDQRFDSLLNLLPIGVSICTDPSFQEIRHNSMAAKFLRIGEWEILSHSAEEPSPVKLLHDGREMSPEEMPIKQSLWFGKNIRKQEIEFVWEDGVRKTSLWSSRSLFDTNGVITGAIAVCEDITERKQAEEALQKAHQREELFSYVTSKLLVSENPQKVVDEVCNKTMEFLNCNVFFNYLVNEPRGCLHLNAYAGIPEEQAQQIEWLNYGAAVCGCVALECRPIISEYISESSDSRTDLVAAYGVKAYACHPLRIDNQVIGTLSFGTCSRMVFSRDELDVMKTVTDYIAIAMERVLSNKRLSASEERYRALAERLRDVDLVQSEEKFSKAFHGIPIMMTLATVSEGRYLDANEALCSGTGYTREEIIGHTSKELNLFPYRDNEKRLEHVAMLLKDGKIENADLNLCSKSGEIRSCLFWSQLLNIDGESCHITGLIDITERKETEQKLWLNHRRLEALEKINQMSNSTTKEIAEFAYQAAMKLTGSDIGWLSFINNDETESNIFSWSDNVMVNSRIQDKMITFKVADSGLWAEAIRQRRPIIINDYSAPHPHKKGLPEGHADLIRFLVVPIFDCDRIVSVISVANKKEDYDDSDIQQINLLIGGVWKIIRRREAEEALRQSEKEKRDILESIADAFYSLDREFRFTYLNRSAEKSMNRPREEIIGRVVDEVFPTFRPEFLQIYRQVMEEEKPRYFENFSQPIQRWIDTSIYPAQNGVSVFYRDIHDRKLAEEKLQTSEELFNKSFKHNPAIMSISEADDGKFIEVNDAWLNTLGFSREEVIGHTPIELNLWSSPSKTFETINDIKEKRKISYEVDVKNREGKSYILLATIEKIIIDGKPCFLSAAIDVTTLKQAEEALRRSEDRFHKAFHLSPLMMAIVSMEDDRFIEVNQKYLDIMEYRREEIIGHTSVELDLYADKDSIIQGLDELIKQNKLNEHEYLVRTRSGKIITVLGSVEVINLNGMDCRIFAVQDISSKKETEVNIARLDRLNLIGEMAASIAHEIRNPMTVVRGFLQLLNSKKCYEEYQSYFTLMIEELDRANKIISEYLSIAKNKKVDLQPKYLDTVIKSLYPILMADANYQDKDIHLDLSKPPMPLIDENEIRQLILNMARNGIEAMSEGGTLTIGTMLEGNEIVLFIKDEGQGLPPNLLDKLGTPFFTTKENGTGLGLAVCYGIAARHNARIDFETNAQGTTFYVRFPLIVT